MPKNIYHVKLTVKEREQLISIISKGKASAKVIMHANILLAADESIDQPKRTESKIAELLHVHQQTVHTVRKAYALGGLDVAISRKKRDTPPIQPKVTGDVEAKIIALSCTEPPKGRSRWTLRLLADKAVELHYIDSISYVAVGNILKKTN